MWYALILLIVLIIAAYFAVIYWLHANSVKAVSGRELKAYASKNVLMVFPHPDDEAVFAAGTIMHLQAAGANVHVVCLTKGEQGGEVLQLSPAELGQLRAGEFNKVMQILGVKNFAMANFADSKVDTQLAELNSYLTTTIDELQPELVITYEKYGIYGHPDHIGASKVISELVVGRGITAWYATLPHNIYARSRKIDKITVGQVDVALQDVLPAMPAFRLGIYSKLLTKYRALLQYKSQNLAHEMPLIAKVMLMPYEYFADKYDQI